jgi:hypothetical protein
MDNSKPRFQPNRWTSCGAETPKPRRFAAFFLDTSSRTFELKTVLLGAETDESTGQKIRK